MIAREEIVKIVGSENVADSPEALADYTNDLSFVQRIRPGSVVKADSAGAFIGKSKTRDHFRGQERAGQDIPEVRERTIKRRMGPFRVVLKGSARIMSR